MELLISVLYKGKGKGKFAPVHVMKACREAQIQLHSFVTWALDGSEWPASPPGEERRYKSKATRVVRAENTFLLLPVLEPRIARPRCSLVCIPTTLSHLQPLSSCVFPLSIVSKVQKNRICVRPRFRRWGRHLLSLECEHFKFLCDSSR